PPAQSSHQASAPEPVASLSRQAPLAREQAGSGAGGAWRQRARGTHSPVQTAPATRDTRATSTTTCRYDRIGSLRHLTTWPIGTKHHRAIDAVMSLLDTVYFVPAIGQSPYD